MYMAACIPRSIRKQSMKQMHPEHVKSKMYSALEGRGPSMVLSKVALDRWNYEVFGFLLICKWFFRTRQLKVALL